MTEWLIDYNLHYLDLFLLTILIQHAHRVSFNSHSIFASSSWFQCYFNRHIKESSESIQSCILLCNNLASSQTFLKRPFTHNYFAQECFLVVWAQMREVLICNLFVKFISMIRLIIICTKNDKRRRKILMLPKTKLDFTKMSHIIIE